MSRKYILGWLVTPIFVTAFALAFLTFHVIFVVTYRFFRKYYRRAVDLGNYSLVLTLRLAGTRVRVSLPDLSSTAHQPIIFVSNHQSLFDIPLLIWYMRAYKPHFIAKRELGKGMPALSHALRNMGSALIDRGNSQQALSAIHEFGSQMERCREAVLIFPEGTRARDGTMKKFKPAGLRTLLRAMPSALIVPIAISGSWELLRWRMRPVPCGATIRVQALSPIDRTQLSEDQIVEAVESRIRDAVSIDYRPT